MAPAGWFSFIKGSRNWRPVRKTRIPKVHTKFAHAAFTCILSACTGPAKVSWEGTQLEVDRGKKFCKELAELNAVRCNQSGRETGGLGISTNWLLSILYNDGHLTGVPSALLPRSGEGR
jgi:hypothetical protein